jgi:hypothetical protein
VRRVLFNVTAVVSMLLFGAVSVLWVRSLSVTDCVLGAEPGAAESAQRTRVIGYRFVSGRGVLLVIRESASHATDSLGSLNLGWRHHRWVAMGKILDPATVRRLSNRVLVDGTGFQLTTRTSGGPPPREERWLRVPYWMMLVMLFPLPVIWMARFARVQSQGVGGRCLNCGYDIRACGNVCSECGQWIRG